MEAFAGPRPFGLVKMASNEWLGLDSGDGASCESTAGVWPHLATHGSVAPRRLGPTFNWVLWLQILLSYSGFWSFGWIYWTLSTKGLCQFILSTWGEKGIISQRHLCHLLDDWQCTKVWSRAYFAVSCDPKYRPKPCGQTVIPAWWDPQDAITQAAASSVNYPCVDTCGATFQRTPSLQACLHRRN